MKRIFAIGLGLAVLLGSGAYATTTALKQYQPGFRLIDGSQLNLMVNLINAITGNGGTVTNGYFSNNTTASTTAGSTGPTPSAGTVIQGVGANSAVARIELDAFGNVPIFTTKRYNGTKAAPTAILSADQLGSFNYHGAVSSTATYGPAARVAALATENWSGTAGGTKVIISTTPNTTQTLTTAATFDQDGSLAIAGGLTVSGSSLTNAVVGVASGYKLARGATALGGSNPTAVATGLTTIVSCNLNIVGTAAPALSTSTLTYGISTTTMNMYAWKPTSISNPTLVASTGTETIGWVCVGT